MGFLRSLGAVSKVPQSESLSERERAYERYRRGLTPRDFDQGDNLPYRIQYTKLGPTALQGHLDMVRLLPRIFRRAGIELVYTQGFHPKPSAQYAPALALGLQSSCELADVRLHQPIAEEELLERLNAVTPTGLNVVAVRGLATGEKKLSKVLRIQDYLLTVPEEWMRQEELLEMCCSRFLAQDRVVIVRARPARDAEIDVRSAVLALDPCPANRWPADIVMRNHRGVRARVLINPSGPTPKPSELARSILDVEPHPADMARIGLWGLDDDGAVVDPMG